MFNPIPRVTFVLWADSIIFGSLETEIKQWLGVSLHLSKNFLSGKSTGINNLRHY